MERIASADFRDPRYWVQLANLSFKMVAYLFALIQFHVEKFLAEIRKTEGERLVCLVLRKDSSFSEVNKFWVYFLNLNRWITYKELHVTNQSDEFLQADAVFVVVHVLRSTSNRHRCEVIHKIETKFSTVTHEKSGHKFFPVLARHLLFQLVKVKQ